MVGGDSKFVLICTHIHKFPHTHTQLISQNGKEIEITHTLDKWGSGSRKKVKNLTLLGRNFPLVSTPMSVNVRFILLVEDDEAMYIRPYIELKSLRAFMCMYMMVTSVPTKRWTLTLSKFDEPFGSRFHFERFLGTDVGRGEGHTFG